jgi:hypothetical protein
MNKERIMKKTFQITLCTVAAVVLLFACRRDKYKELGLPTTVASSLAGTWKLTKVTQTDEDAKNKGFQYGSVNIQTMDLTNTFPYTDFKLTLNTNGSTPTTFTTTPGNSPKIIRLASGNWTFDNPTYPKVITMSNATDTARITLGAYPSGAVPVLKITSERRDATTNKLLISYSYEFSKQ